MGKIVAAVATVHAPQLFMRPPTEIPEQLDADIAAMRMLGKDIEEAKPDSIIVIGSDHLETFFLSSVPTFAVMAGEYSATRTSRTRIRTCRCTCRSPRTCSKSWCTAASTWPIRRMPCWATPSPPCTNGLSRAARFRWCRSS